MQAEVYWIDIPCVRLSIMARPRAGEWLSDEIQGWQTCGITTVVPLLDPSEVREQGLQREADLCEELGIEFLSFPIQGRHVPSSLPATQKMAINLVEKLQHGGTVAIDCRSGIGRSALLAACVISALNTPAQKTSHLFENISKARKSPVPDTDAQRAWLETFNLSLKTADYKT